MLCGVFMEVVVLCVIIVFLKWHPAVFRTIASFDCADLTVLIGRAGPRDKLLTVLDTAMTPISAVPKNVQTFFGGAEDDSYCTPASMVLYMLMQ
jgi:hypothetical protein